MKKFNLLVPLVALSIVLTACQTTATPPPIINVDANSEFTLAPDQTATITNSGLTLRLIGVAGDERCPSEIECAMSGPVSISLSVQMNNGTPEQINLQTFTDDNGRAPIVEFEGITDRTHFQGYVIQVLAVTPYPLNLETKIKGLDYRVTLIVTQE